MSRVKQTSRPTQYIGHFGDGLCKKNAQTHNNKNEKFNLYKKCKPYETQNTKNDLSLKLRTADFNCAYRYVMIMAVLINFPVILQTVTNLIMMSIGGQGTKYTVHIIKLTTQHTAWSFRQNTSM